VADSDDADGFAFAHRGAFSEVAVDRLKAAPQTVPVVNGDHRPVHHDTHEAHRAAGGSGDRGAVVGCL
jgi:hypothetical protein